MHIMHPYAPCISEGKSIFVTYSKIYLKFEVNMLYITHAGPVLTLLSLIGTACYINPKSNFGSIFCLSKSTLSHIRKFVKRKLKNISLLALKMLQYKRSYGKSNQK